MGGKTCISLQLLTVFFFALSSRADGVLDGDGGQDGPVDDGELGPPEVVRDLEDMAAVRATLGLLFEAKSRKTGSTRFLSPWGNVDSVALSRTFFSPSLGKSAEPPIGAQSAVDSQIFFL